MGFMALPAPLLGATSLVGVFLFFLGRRRSPILLKEALKLDQLDLPPGMTQELKLDPDARAALAKSFSRGSDYQWMATKPGEKTSQEETSQALAAYIKECCVRFAERFGYILVQRDETGDYQGSLCLIPPYKSWTLRNLHFMVSVVSVEPMSRINRIPEELGRGKRVQDFTQITQKHEELMKADSNHWHILSLGVSTDHQGKGIGKSLLQVAKKLVVQQNNEKGGALYLECHDENVPLYKKMGYELLERFQLSTPDDGEPYYYNAMILRQLPSL